VAEELGRLADRDLPVIEPNLSDARQLGGQPPRPGQEKAVVDLLKKAGRHQKAVEDGLTDLLDRLAVWGGAGDIRSEARMIRDAARRQAEDIEKSEKDMPAAELDRAGTRAEQASEQANQLLTRAGKLANETLAKRATDANNAAREKTDQAAALRAKAKALPEGTPEKSSLNAQAALLDGEADDLKDIANGASAEADAINKGIKVSGGQAIAEDLRRAGTAARANQRSEAGNLLRSAEGRLDRLIEALAEKQPDTAPELVRAKTKKAADDLDSLAGAQDDIRRRTAEAAKIPDPMKREAELRRLALEQDKVIERGKEVLQRLTRQRADDAARDTRAALEHMETARNDLENGNTGMRAQNDAVERLDMARDKLDNANAAAPQQLSDETRRKMIDKVKAVAEKQRAAVAEADRIHKLVAKDKKWSSVALTEYGDIGLFREEPLAKEVRALEKEFAQLPVLARLLNESAGAMDSAVAKITSRVRDTDPTLAYDAMLEDANNRRVNRPMELAARRLDQLLAALKQDDPKPKKDPPAKSVGPKNTTPPGGGGGAQGGGGQKDIIPPMAQLKVLRALQAELNQRTTDFAKDYPDLTKVTDDDLRKELEDELKELEDAQRDIAALFKQLAPLFQQEKLEKGEKGDTGDTGAKGEKSEKGDKGGKSEKPTNPDKKPDQPEKSEKPTKSEKQKTPEPEKP
jgi:hypothetical protein